MRTNRFTASLQWQLQPLAKPAHPADLPCRHTHHQRKIRHILLHHRAGTDKKGPGPLVTTLSRNSGTLPIPITIVPGDMSKERLEAIT